MIAHLYIAWIHPFEDGNGRTARLLEFLILADCGLIPLPAAQLLSNHYNLTCAAYYRELDKASRNGGKLTDLLVYALQGFVDQVREQIEVVRAQQIEVSWINFVHETMSQFPPTKTTDRRRARVLGMLRNATLTEATLTTSTRRWRCSTQQSDPGRCRETSTLFVTSDSCGRLGVAISPSRVDSSHSFHRSPRRRSR